MFEKHKKIFIALSLILGYIIWSQTFSYNINKAVSHAEKHHCQKSHLCCAWFVMRAMQSGGCPMIILPAWAYRDALPFYGYHEVASGMGNQMNGFRPQKGDVVGIENGKHSIWGHIAIYTGNCWISDFKQKTMSPYRKPVPYKIFRHVKLYLLSTNKIWSFYIFSIS